MPAESYCCSASESIDESFSKAIVLRSPCGQLEDNLEAGASKGLLGVLQIPFLLYGKLFLRNLVFTGCR